MKIIAVDVYTLNSRPPIWRPVVCRVRTDEGIEGWGEAALAFDMGADAAFAMICEMSTMILGQDPFCSEVLWNKMTEGSFWAAACGTIMTGAVSALDTALWDIKGKALDMPVYKLLGGKFRDSLRCYASQLQFGWGREGMQSRGATKEQLTEDVKAALDEGYSAVKLNIINFDVSGRRLGVLKGPLSKDIMGLITERAEAIRAVLGDEADFMLEHHGRTDAVSAAQIAEITGHLDIMFIEEPTPPTDLEAMIDLSRRIATPLAAGERLHSKNQFLRLMQERALGVVQPDIGNCGGITMAKKIADYAQGFGIGVAPHVCGSPIVEAASIQLAAATERFVIHEQMIMARDIKNVELGVYNYEPKNGYIKVPDMPGIGQELSPRAIKNALHSKTITA